MTKLSSSPGRLLGVIAVVIALCSATFAVTYASTAQKGGKITVCVKKSGGALYSAKTCAKGDKKLSWNKQGVAGPAGPAGPAGAVAGYSVAQTGTLTINSNHHVQNTVITTQLPAGSYIVNSKVVAIASDDTDDSFANVECRLGNGTTTDVSKWLENLDQVVFVFAANTTLSNTVAVSSTRPITITLSCSDEHDVAQTGFTESVNNARITAVQTASIG